MCRPGGEEASVLEVLLDVLESRREDHVDLPAVAHRNHRAKLVEQGLREVERHVVLRVVVTVGELEAGPAARAPLESQPAPDRDAAERAAMSHENAIQIPELPVPRRRPGAQRKHQSDTAVPGPLAHACA
jgi:hypothetical protein